MGEKLNALSKLGEIFPSVEIQSDQVQNEYVKLKDQKYDIVSMVAYLIGVRKSSFSESQNFEENIFKKLDINKNARIIRNLSMLRTILEIRYNKLFADMVSGGRSVLMNSEYIPQNVIKELSSDGVRLSQRPQTSPLEYIIEINGLISDRINNCKSIFPTWLNWDYIKDLFVMPDGTTQNGAKAEGTRFTSNLNSYPYQLYINMIEIEPGNLLHNDCKFVTTVYNWNGDEFTERNKLVDVSSQIKTSIYSYIANGNKIVIIVDCENSDVYNIISMLKSLEWEQISKISKIILVNDVHTNAGWNELDKCTDIPIEHVMTTRIKQEKSLVDGKVISVAFTEYYENKVDSFILLSSDSDFWTLIDSLRNKAKFLVMVEHMKCSPDYKDVLSDFGVFYCYLDDFNSSGEAEELRMDILKKTISSKLKEKEFNVKTMLEEALLELRINMDEAQKKQFFQKYLKTMKFSVSDEGKVNMEYWGK